MSPMISAPVYGALVRYFDVNSSSRWPYTFLFFSSDAGELPHIHVKRDRQIAKF